MISKKKKKKKRGFAYYFECLKFFLVLRKMFQNAILFRERIKVTHTFTRVETPSVSTDERKK